MRIEATFLAAFNLTLISGSDSFSDEKLDFRIQPCAVELSPLTRRQEFGVMQFSMASIQIAAN